MNTRNNIVTIVSVLVAATVVAAIVLFMRTPSDQVNQPPVACTQEAMQCPDGSYVGRSGPKCEFAPCPAESPVPEGWKTSTDANTGLSFSYPESIGTTYISTNMAVGWPPSLKSAAGTLNCVPSSTDLAIPVHTLSVNINGQKYCVDVTSEGAAGSTYISYDYKTQRGTNILSLAFTLRYPQCLNYDMPKQSACLEEQETFDVDYFAGRIVGTVKVMK